MFFESHAHYDDKSYSMDRDRLLGQDLPAAGVSTIVNIGACMGSSRRSVALAERYEYVYAAVGVHPHDVANMYDKDMEELAQLAAHPKVVAFGEIGLDFHYNHSPQPVQIRRFHDQMEMAISLGLPVVVHSREADKETLEILTKYASRIKGLVVHCFSGDLALAQKYVDMGFYIGISGVVSYKKAFGLHACAQKLPFNSILLETDCPYLSPEPKRGKRNDSQNLPIIAEHIARLRNTTVAEVAAKTDENARRLFGMPL
ncbi:MAG: TatD family hydrolase [Defluviitaleaceae bacterium]|nr:TatD family hydrolase [Defluviitaleaceae bacterium]